ncbi:hypothetical protein M8494_17255 [Serratia ureilytica]
MQLIAEAYSLLKQALNLSNEQLAETFAEWNKGELNSYLIDITKDIFTKKDEEGKYRRCDPRRSRQQRHRQVDQPELAGSGRTAVADHRVGVCALPVLAERPARCRV